MANNGLSPQAMKKKCLHLQTRLTTAKLDGQADVTSGQAKHQAKHQAQNGPNSGNHNFISKVIRKQSENTSAINSPKEARTTAD